MKPTENRFRILIVDDTPSIHDDFRKILTPASASAPQIDLLAAAVFGESSPTPPPARFEVDCASQGQTGLALVQDALEERRPYALAFVDMRMPPGWDGLETIRHLWAADPHLQIVICTAYSDHSWSAITERLGQSDNLLILKKPFDNVEVLQLSHALARKWRLARDVEAHVAGLDSMLLARTEELRGAEEGFTTAFDASPLAQAIISLDGDPQILAVNSALEHLMGVRRPDVINLTLEVFGRGFDLAGLRELLARLKAGQAVDDHACVYRPTSGKPREMRCSARVLTIRGRRCCIWVLRDITEQLATENQLRQSQKMEAIGQLAAGVAHDFNNLLTVIQGYTAELLAQHDEGPTRQMLEPVQAAATRAANLTRQLLIFSRKEVVRPRQLDLVEVFSELQPLLRRLIGAHIEFQWSVPPRLASVVADPANVEQVIVNLVVNARDSMPEGGRISIMARERVLSATSPELPAGTAPGPFIEFSVTDTGTGIPPSILPRIFEPFFTTKEAGKGTGLGLSTVYSIVKAQGGWITVDSKVASGTTFTVFHPVAEVARGGTVPPYVATPPPPPAEGFRNVLVVEDDPTVKSLLSNILKRRRIPHTMAEDGVIAQEIWRNAPEPFDLLITDIVMPNGINGLRLARNLRQLKPELAVILTSGFSELLSDAKNLQMPGLPPKVLLKPFSPADLVTAINEIHAAPTTAAV